MRTLIIGLGEVGNALYNVLKPTYDVQFLDIQEKEIKLPIDIIHICFRYCDNYIDIVNNYIEKYNPLLINICSTVPVGTTSEFGSLAVHSTTRGLHPKLEEGIKKIIKHIGGEKANEVYAYFKSAGIDCICHKKPETTELAHILNNAAYGINLMLADEMQKICRYYGVDYYESVMKYTETNNEGYIALDNPSKVRPILTPPNGWIGGHCVQMSANLIPEEIRGNLIKELTTYGDD